MIELLVVIVIIGILAAIALPSFLTQSGKAKQTEAKQNLNLIAKTQGIYYMERKIFSSSLNEIGLGTLNGTSTSSTGYFDYLMAGHVDLNKDVHTHADARESGYKSYVAETVVYKNASQQDIRLMTVICESLSKDQGTHIHADLPFLPDPILNPYYTAPIACIPTEGKQIQ